MTQKVTFVEPKTGFHGAPTVLVDLRNTQECSAMMVSLDRMSVLCFHVADRD